MAKKKPQSDSSGNGAKQPHPNDAPPTYFLSASLKNVRCFTEEQTLDLSDGRGRPARWTILLGYNGTGKTTVLQALAIQSESYNSILSSQPPGPNRVKLSRDLLARINRAHGFSRMPDLPISLSASVACGAKLTELGPLPDRLPLVLDAWTGGFIVKADPKNREARAPLCFGYGAARRMGHGSLGEETPTDGLESLFSDNAYVLNAEEWLLRLHYSSTASDQPAQQRVRLGQIKHLLLAILPEVEDIRFVVGTGVNPTSRAEFFTPYGWVPLRQLGYGYQTLITWMVDFASRMAERYPDSPDPLAEPAVVLVDEIDLHLHPKWQRQLIDHLTRNFPNTQFIATAHSPLVVQAAADANIAVLRREGDHVVIDNDAKAIRGWRIDQVLTSDLFGLPTARPPQFDDLLKRRTDLRSKGRLTAAEKRELARVEEQIGDLPFAETAQEAEDIKLIKEALELLNKDQPTKS